MGIWSKTKLYAGTAIQPLIDPPEKPFAEIVISAIFREQSIAKSLVGYTIDAVANKVKAYRDYARNFYTLGLPNGSLNTIQTIPTEDVEAAILIDRSHPYGILIDFSLLTPLDPIYLVLPFLESQRGYLRELNKITVAPPTIIYPSPPPTSVSGGTLQSTAANDITLVDIAVNELGTAITLSYRCSMTWAYHLYDQESNMVYDIEYESDYTTFTEDVIIPAGVDLLNLGRQYCIAKYKVLDEFSVPSTEDYWWYYDITTNVYTDINFAFYEEGTEDLFPVIPIRFENEDLTDEAHQSTDLYITSKKLLKKMNLDIDWLGSQLNANPEIAHIDHAYVFNGISLTTTSPIGQRYLVEFFDHLADKMQVDNHVYLAGLFDDDIATTSNYNFFNYNRTAAADSYTEVTGDIWSDNEETITIHNAVNIASLTEAGLDISLEYHFITSTFKHGSIGLVDATSINITATEVILQLQITESVYKEVVVTGLSHTNNVYRGYAITTTLDVLVVDPTSTQFILPLHYPTVQRMRLRDRNHLYLESFHLVINSYEEVYLDWYARKWFRFIVAAVVVVVTMIVVAYTGQAWLAKAGAGVMALLFAIAYDVFIGYLISTMVTYAFRWLVEKYGLENALIATIVTVVVAVFTRNLGLIKSATKSLMTTAQLLLRLGHALIQVFNMAVKEGLRIIEEKQFDFEDEKVEHMAELEFAQDLLDIDVAVYLDPTILVKEVSRYQQLSSDSPKEFYTRCLANNIGVLSLQVTSIFHETKLTLPKPNYGPTLDFI